MDDDASPAEMPMLWPDAAVRDPITEMRRLATQSCLPWSGHGPPVDAASFRRVSRVDRQG